MEAESKLNMEELKSYKIKGRLGIDNLGCEYAFIGTSQGDTSCSNLIEDYIAAKGWMGVSRSFQETDITNQEAIYKRVEEIKNINWQYINKLYEEGRFGEEYEVELKLNHHPLFDAGVNRNPDNSNQIPLSSYRMFFIEN